MSDHGAVLILTTPFRPNIGGVETHLDDLIKVGSEKGIRFQVITYQPLVTNARGKAREEIYRSVIYRIPWIRLNLFLTLERYPALEFIYLFPPLFLFTLVYLLFSTYQIKVIHAQGLVAGAVGVILGRLFDKRVIISTHSIYNFPPGTLYSIFAKALLKRADRVLTLSKQSMSEVVGLGVDQERVSVFTYWVDQSIFKPQLQSHIRINLGLSPNKFICLFVGRLVSGKGIRELLKAAGKLNDNQKILLIIAGDGPLSLEVKKYSKTCRNLLYLGRIDNHDLPAYYNAADVFIIPSTHEEGFGRVILEALSCGTPVIGSARGAIPEAVNDQVGILINVSPESIAKTLTKLSSDKRLLGKLSALARSYAMKHFSKSNSQMIFKHYQ